MRLFKLKNLNNKKFNTRNFYLGRESVKKEKYNTLSNIVNTSIITGYTSLFILMYNDNITYIEDDKDYISLSF